MSIFIQKFKGLLANLDYKLFYMTFYLKVDVKHGSMSPNLPINEINYICIDNI